MPPFTPTCGALDDTLLQKDTKESVVRLDAKCPVPVTSSLNAGKVEPMPTLPTTVKFDVAMLEVEIVVSVALTNVTVFTVKLENVALQPVKLEAVMVPDTLPPVRGT